MRLNLQFSVTVLIIFIIIMISSLSSWKTFSKLYTRFSIKDFFSKCDQIRRKSLMENFNFCAVYQTQFYSTLVEEKWEKWTFNQNWSSNETFCGISCHLYNLKNVDITHGGMFFFSKFRCWSLQRYFYWK